MTQPLSGILLTGSTGQVGGELLRALAPHAATFGPIHAPVRADFDLANPESLRATIRRLRPRWIVNPAAWTAVDLAESQPDAAYAINRDAVRVLAEEARTLGAHVLHFSTDYVFPGTGSTPWRESDPTGPLNVYGASKLAGEQALGETLDGSPSAYLTLRTSWVFGPTGKNFLLTILRLARERQTLNVVDDQHGAPTSARTLAALAVHLLRHPALQGPSAAQHSGVYHAASAGFTTWFGFAQEAIRLRRLAEPAQPFATLAPVPSSTYPTPARRPSNSRLDCTRLTQTFGYTLPPWQQSVAEACAAL